MDTIGLRSGLELPYVGFGTHLLHGNDMNVAIKAAYDAGYTLFDTAWLYKNEPDLGTAISINSIPRNNVFLTSKFSINQIRKRLGPLKIPISTVKKEFEISCKKLGIEYLDLYLLHSPKFDGYEKVYGKMLDLQQLGKIKAVGICNSSKNHLLALKKVYGVFPEVNQIEIHPFNQQKETIDFCKENGIVVEAYSPYGRGAVLRELTSNPLMTEIAKNHSRKVTQVILRWVIQQGLIALPRSSSPQHIVENVSIFDFELTDEEMRAIGTLDRNQHYGKEYDIKY